MSIFLRSPLPKQIGTAYRFISTAPARCHYWLPDLKPGPYPKTKEEREAAAKKYNLLPEEYEPYPENSDDALGDYPNLPFDSVDSKDPWYPWDHKELRRNYGEPLHLRSINLLPEALSTGPLYISHEKGTLVFFGLIIGSLTIIYLLHQVKIITPVMEEQMVTPGVTHYTFNLKEGKKGHRGKKGHGHGDNKGHVEEKGHAEHKGHGGKAHKHKAPPHPTHGKAK